MSPVTMNSTCPLMAKPHAQECLHKVGVKLCSAAVSTELGLPKANGIYVFSVMCRIYCPLNFQCPIGIVYTFVSWKSSGREFHSFYCKLWERLPLYVVLNPLPPSFLCSISWVGRVGQQLIILVRITHGFIKLSHVAQLFHTKETYPYVLYRTHSNYTSGSLPNLN